MLRVSTLACRATFIPSPLFCLQQEITLLAQSGNDGQPDHFLAIDDQDGPPIAFSRRRTGLKIMPVDDRPLTLAGHGHAGDDTQVGAKTEVVDVCHVEWTDHRQEQGFVIQFDGEDQRSEGLVRSDEGKEFGRQGLTGEIKDDPVPELAEDNECDFLLGDDLHLLQHHTQSFARLLLLFQD